MPARLLDVDAYTTFDYLEASARGHGWIDESIAVLDVDRPREDPGTVRLRIELDGTDLVNVDPHADSVSLSPAQARKLAAELEARAADAEEGVEVPRSRRGGK